ncbi:MAG: D-alanine--D-alanine ligase [Saprospiraceae bacterium]
MKIGIFFGGPSREREIAFAGGRTVYDNLNKSLFEPVLLFVDSARRLILLDWQYVYKGTIRDFYPPVAALPDSPNAFQIYVESLGKLSASEAEKMIAQVGRQVAWSELPELIDVAFLSLHGEFGEDGQIQGLLEGLQIPYTGSGIRACAIGMDKAFQKKLMEAGDFPCPEVLQISRSEWTNSSFDTATFFASAKQQIGFPMVIRPANQGSSIGVAIINESTDYQQFIKLIDRAFFRERIYKTDWQNKPQAEKIIYLRELTDIRDGLGFPLNIGSKTIYHPEELLTFLNEPAFAETDSVLLESHLGEQTVIVEEFIHGKEFSCVVLKREIAQIRGILEIPLNSNGSQNSIALPPTEIIKGSEVFDYRSKYLPGLSRKVTPIDLPNAQINAIRREVERLFEYLEFNTYARIDGFIQTDGTIFLNDPNTTSGMLPSSFFFHQAAEIGLNPSQFLTYIIRVSLQERIATSMDIGVYDQLLADLDQNIAALQQAKTQKKKIAVLLGGYSAERHISVESGRNIFEKLASSNKYEPVPVFVTGSNESHQLYQIPINLLLKDNADDIRDKILNYKVHTVVEDIKMECKSITDKYASSDVVFAPKALNYSDLAELADGVFIALHGRPGEDGQVQKELRKRNIPYNGSNAESSEITINKYRTLQLLKQNGFPVTQQRLLSFEEYAADAQRVFGEIAADFDYPLIAKPVDDGCSAAVKLIKTQEELAAYFALIFRGASLSGSFPLPLSFNPDNEAEQQNRAILKLKPKEEFPQKNVVLIEQLISRKDAIHFLEITGGLLTHHEGDAIRYEVFEPSEALASGEVLSLEEKFLAGEGQNITPARFAIQQIDYQTVAQQVRADLKRAAKILNVQGYARIDAFVRVFADGKAETIIIEVNSLPGMTPATCIYHQAAINGYKPFDFIDGILEFGFGRKELVEG